MEKDVSDEREWQFDIIIVFLNVKDIVKDKDYHIKYMEDVII